MATIPDKMHGLVVESYAKSEEEEKKPYKFKESLDVPAVEPHQILIKVHTACTKEMLEYC
jgi:hypothetical protein